MTKQTDRPAPPGARRRLTPLALALLGVLALPGAALAQWTQPDANNNTHNNPTSGNVGVGTANPLYGKLQINKSVRIDDDTGSASGSDAIGGAPSLYIGTTAGGGHLQYNSGGGLDLWQYYQGDWRRTITFAKTGWVGIGTTSPLNQLHIDSGPGSGVIRVSGAGKGAVNFRDNTAGPNAKQYQWHSSGGKFYMGLTTDLDGELRPNILVADSAGHVGVGTASPVRGLHVSGGDGSTGAEFILENRGMEADHRRLNLYGKAADGGSGRFYLRLINDAGTGVTREFLAFDNATGNVGVGTQGPAERLEVNGKVKASGLCLGGTCKSSWSEVVGQWAGGAGGSGPIHYAAGHVGVGTNNPAHRLHVAGGGGLFQGDGVSTGGFIQFWKDAAATRAADLGMGVPGGALTDDLIFSRYAPAAGWSESLRIQNATGNVGVGTASPTAKLEVNAGSAEAVAIKATGTIMADNIVAKFQDVAEWVPSTQKLSAGTVVVLDAGRANHVLASTAAYDTRVAGVVSARPGIALGEGGEGKALVATTGRVKVKVDASRAPVRIGDLLVTGDAEGVAMRSEPVTIGGRQFHAPGTIIGKALEPLEGGVGEILVLLSLQ